MKKHYEEPRLDWSEFQIEDVITASDGTGAGGTEIINPFGVEPVG